MKFRVKVIGTDQTVIWNSTTDEVRDEDVIDTLAYELREIQNFILNGEYRIEITPE